MVRKLEDVVLANRAASEAAQESFGAWIASLQPWSYFVTFTYDPKKSATGHNPMYAGSGSDRTLLPISVGLQKLRRDMKRFVFDVGRELDGLHLVAGFEPHESGSPHAHALAHPKRGARLGDIRAMHEAWYLQHGTIIVEELTRGAALASQYVVKFDRIARYTTKHQGDVFFSRSLNVG